MLLKVAIAILLAFVIAVPLTFWLLKKVRIKSKVRHVQVSLALGLPAALFTYFLQTSFALPVIVATISFALVIAAIELTLRRIVAHLPVSRADGQTNKIGSGVAFEEARFAASAYPDDYMTESLWLEMQQFMESRSKQKQLFKTSSDLTRPINSFKMHERIDFRSSNYSMVNGVRNTTDIPEWQSCKQIALFGGSTMLCEEVPDRLTCASFLQRMLNIQSESFQVFNYGASGATSIDRVQMLMETIALNKDDAVVFYFGDNDSGWIDHRSGKLSQQLVWLPIRALKALSDFGSETAKWIYGEFSPRSFRKFSRSAVTDTIKALNGAHEYCLSKGAHMIVVLQPNLYTLQTKSEYEKKLEKQFSQDIKTLVIDAYKQYEAWVKQIPFGVSATHIFNNAPSPVFLDWAHVNARGNELIAKFIFEELKKRKLISVDEEV